MSRRRAEVGLGDLLRVLAEIPLMKPSEQELVARCLGFQASKLANKSLENNLQAPQKSKDINLKNTVTESASELEEEFSFELPDEILPINIEKLQDATHIELSPPFPRQEPIKLGASNDSPLLRLPLFPKRTVRGLLKESIAQPSLGSELDMTRLIRATVEYQPLRSLPLSARLTIKQGCQLLLDFNEALVPWWDDMHDLKQQFHAVLGEAACPIYEFTDNPHHAVRWTEFGKQAWQTVTGKPVVIATDLGQVRTNGNSLRVGLSTWREFALHCQRRQIPVIVLTPLGHKSCPKELSNFMSIIDWSSSIRASDVKRLLNYKKGLPT